jgi:hypothetical protein
VNYLFHHLPLTSEIRLPELHRSRARGSVSVELGPRPDTRACDWFHHWRIKAPAGKIARRPWLSFARHDGGYVLRFADLADFEVSPASDRVRCRPAPGLPLSTLRHLLLDQTLPLVLSQHVDLVLHASAVHIDGVGTVGFAGRAGCGKSTLAAALGLRGHAVVADDTLVITRVAGRPTVLPGYPGLRLWRDAVQELGLTSEPDRTVAHYTDKCRIDGDALRFRSRSSPLRALFVLGRRRATGNQTRVAALRPRDRLMALTPYTYLMDVEDRGQLARMFGNLSGLVTHVPVFRLNVEDARGTLLESAGEFLTVLARLGRATGAPTGAARLRAAGASARPP